MSKAFHEGLACVILEMEMTKNEAWKRFVESCPNLASISTLRQDEDVKNTAKYLKTAQEALIEYDRRIDEITFLRRLKSEFTH